VNHRGNFWAFDRGQKYSAGEAHRRKLLAGYKAKIQKRRRGLCWSCTAKAVVSHSHCQRCLDLKRERNRQKRGWADRKDPRKLKGRRMDRRVDMLVSRPMFHRLTQMALEEDVFIADLVRDMVQTYFDDLDGR
jgi:hypothetical protein